MCGASCAHAPPPACRDDVHTVACGHHRDNFVPVLLGFNPVAAAKPPPGDCKRDIVAELGKLACPGDAAQGVVINPVVGPEPIAGSTRACSRVTSLLGPALNLCYAALRCV